MNSKSSRFLIILALGLSITLPAFAGSKQSQLDKTVEIGQKAFDSGNFAKAERSWQRAQTEMSKAGAADEKLARVLVQLGDCYYKEGKFSRAEATYEQSLEVLKGLSLDQTDTMAKLKELAAFFRPINLEGFDENATAFAKQVGAVCASALNKDDKRHIDISLKKRFQEGIKELIESVPASLVGGTGEHASAAGADSISAANSPPVKQIRLDKQIAFDVVRGDVGGNLKLANIEGIFLNVGLWVKLKEFVMLVNEKNTPVAEVTAGAFGVDKKVRVDLPQNLFARLKQGIDKIDPFISVLPQVSAAGSALQPANSALPVASGSAAVSSPAVNSAQAVTSNSSSASTPASNSTLPASSTLPATSTLPAPTAPEL